MGEILKLSHILDRMVYEGWIDFRFTFVHKGVLVIMEGRI